MFALKSNLPFIPPLLPPRTQVFAAAVWSGTLFVVSVLLGLLFMFPFASAAAHLGPSIFIVAAVAGLVAALLIIITVAHPGVWQESSRRRGVVLWILLASYLLLYEMVTYFLLSADILLPPPVREHQDELYM